VAGPSCSCCYDVEFDAKVAAQEARAYRRSGAHKETRALADALAGADASGLTVLDVGGGVGALHHLLLQRGAASAVDVDASGPYLEVARQEAERLGLADRIGFVHGDFVGVAPGIEPADLVALDRVVCCYPDARALVVAAAARTRRRLGIVIPPDNRLARFMVRMVNLWERVQRSAFRMQAHPHETIVTAAASEGLQWVATRSVGIWQLLVFERPA
jgi:SAM-dependent methyltransferase